MFFGKSFSLLIWARSVGCRGEGQGWTIELPHEVEVVINKKNLKSG